MSRRIKKAASDSAAQQAMSNVYDRASRDRDQDAQGLEEVAPPGMESWIKKNKSRFKKQYGDKKGTEVLYATAWKRKNANESVKLDEISAISPIAKAIQSGTDKGKSILQARRRKANKIPHPGKTPVSDYSVVGVPSSPEEVFAHHGLKNKDFDDHFKNWGHHSKDREKWINEEPPLKQQMRNAQAELLDLEYPSLDRESPSGNEELDDLISTLYRDKGYGHHFHNVISGPQHIQDVLDAEQKGYIKADTYSGDDFSNPSDKVLSEKSKKGIKMNKSKSRNKPVSGNRVLLEKRKKGIRLLGETVIYRNKRAKVRNSDKNGKFVEIIYEKTGRSEIVDSYFLKKPKYVREDQKIIIQKEMGDDSQLGPPSSINPLLNTMSGNLVAIPVSAIAGAAASDKLATSPDDDEFIIQGDGDDSYIYGDDEDVMYSDDEYSDDYDDGDEIYYTEPQQEDVDLEESPVLSFFSKYKMPKKRPHKRKHHKDIDYSEQDVIDDIYKDSPDFKGAEFDDFMNLVKQHRDSGAYEKYAQDEDKMKDLIKKSPEPANEDFNYMMEEFNRFLNSK